MLINSENPLRGAPTTRGFLRLDIPVASFREKRKVFGSWQDRQDKWRRYLKLPELPIWGKLD